MVFIACVISWENQVDLQIYFINGYTMYNYTSFHMDKVAIDEQILFSTLWWG